MPEDIIIKEIADTETLSNNRGKIERDAKGRLAKGVILNPAGKPKGTKHFQTVFKELVMEEIKTKSGKNMSVIKAIATAMAHKAINGSVYAADFVANRLDGLPSQDVNLEISVPPTPIYSGRSAGKK